MTRRLGWVLALGMVGCGGAAASAPVQDATDVHEADIRGRGVRECADAPEQVSDGVQRYLYVGEQAFVLATSDGSPRRIEAGEQPRATLEALTRELRRAMPELDRLHVIVDPYVSDGEAEELLEVLHAEGVSGAARCRPSEHSPHGSVGEALEAAQSYRR